VEQTDEPTAAGEQNEEAGQHAGGNGLAEPEAPQAQGGDGAVAPGGASEQEAAASRERYLRLAAEFDNYRKRVEREKSESWNRAQAQLAEKLLDVLDDLQRVAQLDPGTTTAQSVMEGTQLVERKLARALESAGVEEVPADGAFVFIGMTPNSGLVADRLSAADGQPTELVEIISGAEAL